jgi:hypothetical protein
MFSGGKGGRCVGLTTLPPLCADCLEIWGSLNLLETSGPVQTCNGIVLPCFAHTVVILMTYEYVTLLKTRSLKILKANAPFTERERERNTVNRIFRSCHMR